MRARVAVQRRNPVAKAVRSPVCRQRVVRSRKVYTRKGRVNVKEACNAER